MKMNISADQLRAIMPQSGSRADKFVSDLNSAMVEFEINTRARASAFLAQIAHESGQLRYVRELASGGAYDTGSKAKALGNTPEADGDGQRYRGRGLIQITGHANYAACGSALGLDLVSHPELLETPQNACRSAAWFWQSRGLNSLADGEQFTRITKRINGGTNGLAERKIFWERARAELGA